MNRIDKALVCGVMVWLSGAVGIFGDLANDQAEAYQAIIQRNAFGLKPPPPPVDPAALQPPPAPVNINFTGITTTFGIKKAYFRVPTATNANVFTYPVLREGEKEGLIEVLKINEKTGSVDIRNGGTLTTLTFDANGIKTPGMAAPVGPAGNVPKIASLPINVPRPAILGQAASIPSAAMPLPTVAPQQAAAQTGVGGIQFNLSQGIPARSIRTSPVQTPPLTAEQSEALVEVQRVLNADQIKAGLLPPLPPTSFSPGSQTPNLPVPGGQ